LSIKENGKKISELRLEKLIKGFGAESFKEIFETIPYQIVTYCNGKEGCVGFDN